MTNQEILTKAIEKAIAEGWSPPYFDKNIMTHGYGRNQWYTTDYDLLFKLGRGEEMCVASVGIIYDHDFAKALWGETIVDMGYHYHEAYEDKVKIPDMPVWKYHLQQMVIADDPIKYLAEHLDA